ncbi:ASF1 like histone chaperone (nucleomorph) [Chroomonas mesostigmatica CCMP1168]|uniref:ASF1 like histone chaperone n=1 Tax=Chroomonas mesostigmatica CCMP1168 TaxID=1195612 RepID=J7G829_9CRYP|nr:ASF1 like histone chaperone [Chroomonas mesostigmatica CCMP1168]|mmetsp:Transcript_290/g.785  ORF Transcript_290/g.785 Transcript_290/m.785 type:complete len:158 (-) Transcript_290:331-804(-)
MKPLDILSIKVKNNFINVENFFVFEIFYEVKKILKKDFELKITYVISPNDKKQDQELGVFLISAKKLGKFKMPITVHPPSYFNFVLEKILGITIILLDFRYENKEFIRIGYYINNEVDLEKKDFFETNNNFDLKYIIRKILVNQPRITHFPFLFDDF